MATGDKPLVSILMAVYEPRLDWLREQLDSLNAQTYPNLRLYIRDDCSPTVPFEQVRKLVDERITAFPYTIVRNEENLGSNKTFERLTAEAEGAYFSYCDQDDVWLPQKTAALVETLEREKALIVCSDMHVIDGEGRRTAESVLEVRRKQKFLSGEGLKMTFLTTNFVTGTAMLIRADMAKAAIPFSPYTVHDWYLALYAARLGKIVSLPDKLLDYRIHGANQTIPMKGIHDKKSYYERQVFRRTAELKWLRDCFLEDEELTAEFDSRLKWLDARKRWYQGEKTAAAEIWKGRAFGPLTAIFELAFCNMPEKLFMAFVELKRRRMQ